MHAAELDDKLAAGRRRWLTAWIARREEILAYLLRWKHEETREGRRPLWLFRGTCYAMEEVDSASATADRYLSVERRIAGHLPPRAGLGSGMAIDTTLVSIQAAGIRPLP